MGLRKSALPMAALGAVAVAAVAGGCSGADPGTNGSGTPATTGTSAPVAAPPPPVTHEPETGGLKSPDPPTPRAPAPPPDGSCGTVHAQNGLNLQVVDLSASGVDCAEAERLIRDLAAGLIDQQSGGVVSMSVQSLVCAPGLPSGMCSNLQRTFRARIVP